MIVLFVVVMKIVRRVYNGKDCGFGPDPAPIISIGHEEKWVIEKSEKRIRRGLRLTRKKKKTVYKKE